MDKNGHLTPARIRASLNHPVIDADGHWVEYEPVVSEQLRRIGGDRAAEGFLSIRRHDRESLSMSVAERRRRRIPQEAFWSAPAKNTRDRATAMLPQLLYERLDELGIDFAVLYPTVGLRIPRIADDKVRRATCRAFNVLTAEYFRDFADRITPAAVIPVHTPEEVIEELEYCTRQLGFKVAMFGSLVPRPVAAIAPQDPDAARFLTWYDTLGLDSEYDYDPLWAKCAELGIAPTFHTGSRRQGLRLSPTNFTYNHIGHFAAAGEAVCKALFLGGVTRRFPRLRFAFLEGGVGWACMLYADLVGHWEKRNRKALEDTDPRVLDRALLAELARKYGSEEVVAALRERDGWPDPDAVHLTGGLADLDDYSACRIERREDLRDLFVPSFYFGCEADDPINAWAFDPRVNPFGSRLNAIFGSDIGHFDVPDMLAVLGEAFELVEDGLIAAEDFRDFAFANAVRLWGAGNPRFFEGTVVEKAAAAVLAEMPGPAGSRIA
ncbi:MAG: amidohydrolase family protein [Candidatus Rokubacteria bacterium]|nr:amidohydrolase family protein [Candidatus Rokubacteria bacterium]